MDFDKLGLSKPILQAIAEKGYQSPSPVQEKAIPPVLEGKDVMAAAQTGTGKTAAFTLPTIELLSRGPRVQANQARALILTPTRELAAQIGESILTYGKFIRLRSAVVYGGVKVTPQKLKLRRGVDILVATPGRLLDLFNQRAINFKQLEILVFDEADRMIDMGFIHDIKKILSHLPKDRQTLMFSATFSPEIQTLAKSFVKNPVEVSVTPQNITSESVEQWVCPVDKNKKAEVLVWLIRNHEWDQVLVFSRTRHGANKLARYITSQGIQATAIHGDKTQAARTKALADFKKGRVSVLVATDIAARGLDIDQLPQVVNFDLPYVPEDYVHRTGRTGRAGLAGQAISLVSADEAKKLFDIERFIKATLPRKIITGFDPVNILPTSAPKKTRTSQKKKSEASKKKSEASKKKSEASKEAPQDEQGSDSNSKEHKPRPYRGKRGGKSSGGKRGGKNSGGKSSGGKRGGKSSGGKRSGKSSEGKRGGKNSGGKRGGKNENKQSNIKHSDST